MQNGSMENLKYALIKVSGEVLKKSTHSLRLHQNVTSRNFHFLKQTFQELVKTYNHFWLRIFVNLKMIEWSAEEKQNSKVALLFYTLYHP